MRPVFSHCVFALKKWMSLPVENALQVWFSLTDADCSTAEPLQELRARRQARLRELLRGARRDERDQLRVGELLGRAAPRDRRVRRELERVRRERAGLVRVILTFGPMRPVVTDTVELSARVIEPSIIDVTGVAAAAPTASWCVASGAAFAVRVPPG